MLLLRNKDQQKKNLLQVRRRNGALVNCKVTTARHHDREPGSCAVCVLPANKLSLQELNQLIKMELLTS